MDFIDYIDLEFALRGGELHALSQIPYFVYASIGRSVYLEDVERRAFGYLFAKLKTKEISNDMLRLIMDFYFV